jgi:hypothetical protein
MSFIDTDVLLTGTPFSQEDMDQAREVWRWVDRRYALEWLQRPRGVLGLDWSANNRTGVCRLIHIAQVIYTLVRNVTKKSVPVLQRKVRALVEAKPARTSFREPKQFQELLTELEVTALISQRASPVALEPFVPEDAKEYEAQRSPDFAVKLPDGWVAFEATVLYVGRLEIWERQVFQFRRVIREKIGRRGVLRDIELKIPLSFDAGEGSALVGRSVFERIVERESGSIIVPMSGGDASIAWRPLSVFSNLPAAAAISSDIRGFAVTGGVAPSSGVAIQWSPIVNPQALELMVLASLRNTLRAKRNQFPGGVEYVLVVRPGHHRVPPEGILSLTRTRIWPNPTYSWVTGLMTYRPPLQGCAPAAGPAGEMSLNPNAERGPSPNLKAMIEAGATFHL